MKTLRDCERFDIKRRSEASVFESNLIIRIASIFEYKNSRNDETLIYSY
jgi:hypothetical protein